MNYEEILKINPVLLALFGTLFTWGVTALGASLVFFFKNINRKFFNLMLGFAAGVMIPAVVGFLAGGAFLFVLDKILPHLHLEEKTENAEGIKTSWHRSVLLVLAITLHNIPEGLAIGVAFGVLAQDPSIGVLTSAIALTIGIGIQNFPEGAAVSVPLRREGFSRWKAFKYGQLSGMVEPVAGVLGALLVLYATPILPYALAFAAGAMIFVVVEELIPESHNGNETDYSSVGVMIGFAIMMFLDVSLG
jgi:ZIP family zinc transporter